MRTAVDSEVGFGVGLPAQGTGGGLALLASRRARDPRFWLKVQRVKGGAPSTTAKRSSEEPRVEVGDFIFVERSLAPSPRRLAPLTFMTLLLG